MSKKKVIYSYYDKYIGDSHVAIKTKYGTFIGSSILHEEDEDIASEFIGCKYAEMRAIIKYEKAKLKELEIQLKTVKNLEQNIQQINNYEYNSAEARYLRKQFYIYNSRVKQQKEKIKILQNELYKSIQNYRQEKEEFSKKITEMREKRNKKAIEE